MENCIFCKIIEGKIPSTVVYQNDRIFAFKDINPVAPVHLLIIPKKHIPTLSHCDESDTDLLGEMMALVPKLAAEHGCAVTGDTPENRDGGYRVVINVGPNGSQDVYHLHIHLIGGPRPWQNPHGG